MTITKDQLLEEQGKVFAEALDLEESGSDPDRLEQLKARLREINQLLSPNPYQTNR